MRRTGDVEPLLEEADQLKTRYALRGFITRYSIPYIVLMAGTPDELVTVVPQRKPELMANIVLHRPGRPG